MIGWNVRGLHMLHSILNTIISQLTKTRLLLVLPLHTDGITQGAPAYILKMMQINHVREEYYEIFLLRNIFKYNGTFRDRE